VKEWVEMHGRGFGYYPGNGMMGDGNWLGIALMVLFWVAIVVIVVLMITRMAKHGGMMHGTGAAGMTPVTPTHDEAVAIARKRYAAGEVTKEQFDELMKTLS
jgi:putative membrane protein